MKNTQLLEKLMSRCIENKTGCLIWQGATSSNGYAHIRRNRKTINCHRLVKEITSGESGAVAMHVCDNRNCLNPSHIEWGTQKRNIQDMVNRNRSTIAVISRSQALEIRKLYSSGSYTQKELAEKFGTSQTNVSSITMGKSWKLAA